MRYKCTANDYNFSISTISIFPVTREKNYRHSFITGRPCHAFIYTENGRMLDEFLDPSIENVITTSGTLIFIPKGTKYYGTYLDDCTEIKTIQFDIDSGELPEYLRTPRIIDLKNAKTIINSFFHSIGNARANQFFHYLSLLYDLLWQIEAQNIKLPNKYSRLAAALDDMSLHPGKNEKISYYAEMCYMSEGNFRRLFREHIGTSPIDYRNDIRLKNARTMLQSGEYNVSECAELTGFSNLSFFTRLYKKKYGYTPKEE